MIGNISSTSGGATMGGIAAAGGAQMEHLLARVKQEKIASRARAWEENAKSKALNRYSISLQDFKYDFP
jgi:predicted acylesterase/phospholipase RssA